MSFWLVVGVCAAVFVLVVAVAGSLNLFNQPMSDETSSQPVATLPEDFTGADVNELRFTVVPRGYRPDEVDSVLDRLNGRIAELQERLAAGAESTATGAERADGTAGATAADEARRPNAAGRANGADETGMAASGASETMGTLDGRE